MPKVRIPFLSFSASGRLGKLFTVRRRKRDHILEKIPKPTDARSTPQLAWRHMYTKCSLLWHELSIVERQQFESDARPRHMTGFAWFMSQCLRPNPGIYLPLQGGTMSGDIDMDGFRVLNLPAPLVDQEAATKKYVDDSIIPAAPTKEFFIPVTGGTGAMGSVWGHWICRMDAIDEQAYLEFYVPDDFTSITEAAIICFGEGTGDWNSDIDIYSFYGAEAQSVLTHQESDLVSTYTVSNIKFRPIDISGILSNLAAGDHVGLRVKKKQDLVTEPMLDIVGIHFKYS